jgi:hypothetical protein
MGRVDLQRGAQQRLGCSWAGPGALQLGEPAEEPLVAGSAGHQHPGQGLAAPQLADLAQEGVSDLGGNPDGVVAGGHEPGVVWARMSALVRSGLEAAKYSARGPASICARRAARSQPTSSKTTASSSA